MNTTCHVCGDTFIPMPDGNQNEPYCGRCRPLADDLTRLFNAIWTEYRLGYVYQDWRDTPYAFDKCADALPENLRYGFRMAWDTLNKHAPARK